MRHLLAGQRRRCGQMGTLCLETILIRLIVHRILFAIVTSVGIGATYTQRTMWPAALEFARLITMDAVASLEAEREDNRGLI